MTCSLCFGRTASSGIYIFDDFGPKSGTRYILHDMRHNTWSSSSEPCNSPRRWRPLAVRDNCFKVSSFPPQHACRNFIVSLKQAENGVPVLWEFPRNPKACQPTVGSRCMRVPRDSRNNMKAVCQFTITFFFFFFIFAPFTKCLRWVNCDDEESRSWSCKTWRTRIFTFGSLLQASSEYFLSPTSEPCAFLVYSAR